MPGDGHPCTTTFVTVPSLEPDTDTIYVFVEQPQFA